MKLYEIDEEIMRLLDASFEEPCIDDETGEVWESISARLEQLSMERQDKIENLACMCKEYEAEAAAIKVEEAHLNERRKRKERAAARLKEWIKENMQRFGDSKIETARVALSLRKSTAVEITDESRLPADYYKQVIEYRPDKAGIKRAIECGRVIPGAELRENKNLVIR